MSVAVPDDAARRLWESANVHRVPRGPDSPAFAAAASAASKSRVLGYAAMRHLSALVAGLLLLSTARSTAQQSALSVRDLVGTWTLEATQQGIGTPQQAAVPNPRGLVIFDSAG